MEELLSTVFLLFLVMDPIGNIPLFLVVLDEISHHKKKWIIAREVIFALFILVFFLYMGNLILQYLKISQSSLKISGSIILMIISIRMIFPPIITSSSNEKITSGIFGELPEGEPFIFPLAMPSLAGPSAIITVIVLSNQKPEKTHIWLLAIIISSVLSLLILLSSSFIARFAGKKGIFAMEKLMGMILIAISVEMFIKGILELLKI